MNKREIIKSFAAGGGIISVGLGIGAASSYSDLTSSNNFFLLMGIATFIAAVSAVIMIAAVRRSRRKGEGRIFLVYATEDQEKVEELYDALKHEGFKPWMATKDLFPGQRWQYAIKNAIEESVAALVFLSKNSVAKKGFVQKELDLALSLIEDRNGGVSPVIPVRLEETDVPPKLKNLHWLDLFREGSFDKLILSLKMAVSVS